MTRPLRNLERAMLIWLVAAAAVAAPPGVVVRQQEVTRAQLEQPIQLDCPAGQTTRLFLPAGMPAGKISGSRDVRRDFAPKYETVPRPVLSLRPSSSGSQGTLILGIGALRMTLKLSSVSKGVSSDIELILVNGDGKGAAAGQQKAPAPAPEGEATKAAKSAPVPPPATRPKKTVPKARPAASVVPDARPLPTPPATATGELRIVVKPWARVEIDGALVGVSPLDPIALVAGDHRVRLTNPEFETVTQLVTVSPGETKTVLVNLTESGTAPGAQQAVESPVTGPAPQETAPNPVEPPPTPPERAAGPPQPSFAAPAPATAIDGAALAVAKAVRIGRREGLEGEPVAELEDALKGEAYVWFRIKVAGAGEKRVERASVDRGGSSEEIKTVLAMAEGKHLRVVVQVPRAQLNGEPKLVLKIAGGATYRFTLSSPLLHNFIRSLF